MRIGPYYMTVTIDRRDISVGLLPIRIIIRSFPILFRRKIAGSGESSKREREIVSLAQSFDSGVLCLYHLRIVINVAKIMWERKGDQMQEAILQAVLLYVLYIIIISLLFRLAKKVRRRKIILFVFIVLLLSPLTLYLPVEYHTYLHGREFEDVKIDTGFSGPVIYYKIYGINNDEATLFYVEGEEGRHECGNLYRCVKEDGKWVFDDWLGTVWTEKGGSASEFILPAYF